MQEVFEKIKEKLEERKEDIAGYIDDDIFLGEYRAYRDSIEIVNQVAEEHAEDTNVPTNTMTNADRIRAMTDEELINVLPCPYDTAGDPEDIMPCIIDGDIKPVSEAVCRKCMLDWLRREAKK